MRRLAAVLVLGPVVLAACSGGGGGGRPTKAAYIKELDAKCKVVNDRLGAIPAPTTPQELADGLRKVISENTALEQDLRAVKPPAGDDEKIKALLDEFKALIPKAETVQRAAQTNDQNGLTAALGDLESGVRKAQADARAYGFVDCGGASSTSSTSPAGSQPPVSTPTT